MTKAKKPAPTTETVVSALRLDTGDTATMTDVDGSTRRLKVARTEGVRTVRVDGAAVLCVRIVGHDAKGMRFHVDVPAQSDCTVYA